MSDCDPIIVAGDDGEILTDGDGIHCSHCGERFDPRETRGTFDGDTAMYQCPACGTWTEGPPPG